MFASSRGKTSPPSQQEKKSSNPELLHKICNCLISTKTNNRKSQNELRGEIDIFHFSSSFLRERAVMHQQKGSIFPAINIPDDQTQHFELNKLHW